MKPACSPTTVQSLAALLESARDVMRKDKSLFRHLRTLTNSNGDDLPTMATPTTKLRDHAANRR